MASRTMSLVAHGTARHSGSLAVTLAKVGARRRNWQPRAPQRARRCIPHSIGPAPLVRKLAAKKRRMRKELPFEPFAPLRGHSRHATRPTLRHPPRPPEPFILDLGSCARFPFSIHIPCHPPSSILAFSDAPLRGAPVRQPHRPPDRRVRNWLLNS